MVNIHKKEILHRDIKTDNILCSSNDSGFGVTDFGLSIFLECCCGAKIPNPSELVGTEFFQAPEVKKEGKHSKGSDVYSLGVVADWITEWYLTIPTNDPIHGIIRSCLDFEPTKRPTAEKLLGKETNPDLGFWLFMGPSQTIFIHDQTPNNNQT